MKYFHFSILYCFILIVNLPSFELWGGRPMGTDIAEYHDKKMPFVLVHRSYADTMNGDTTEKIVTEFSGSLITNVYWYRDDPREDTLVVSQHAIFKYSGDAISIAAVLARADDKLVPNRKINYSYTDSTETTIFSVVLSVGSSHFLPTFQDIYHLPDSNMTLRHHHFSFIDLGTGQGTWYKTYQKTSLYNAEHDIYEKVIKISIPRYDTTLTKISYSAQKDSLIRIVSQIKKDQPPVIEEKITTLFNGDGKKNTTYVQLYEKNVDSLVLSYIEYFYYGSDSLRYEVSSRKDDSSNIELTTAENHSYDSLGRTKKIVYFIRDVQKNQWDLIGEDLLMYDNIAEIANPVFNVTSPHSISVNHNCIIINSNRKISDKGELFNLCGRKIATIKPVNTKNGTMYMLPTALYAKGQYFFKLAGGKRIIVTPVVISIYP